MVAHVAASGLGNLYSIAGALVPRRELAAAESAILAATPRAAPTLSLANDPHSLLAQGDDVLGDAYSRILTPKERRNVHPGEVIKLLILNPEALLRMDAAQ